LNRDTRTRQDFCQPPGENYDNDIKEALSYLFAHDCCSHLPMSVDDENHEVEFVPKTGWFSNNPQVEELNDRTCKLYQTRGMQFRSLIRSDPHAKQTRIPRSQKDEEMLAEHKEKYDDYFNESEDDPFSTSDKPEGLVWSTEKVRRNIRKFDSNLWIADEYPLTIQQFLSFMEVYSPTSQAWKQLQDFISMGLPAGFPLKVEIPVFYFLSAEAQFTKFSEESPDESHFTIPMEFKEVKEAYIGSEAREMFKVVESKGEK